MLSGVRARALLLVPVLLALIPVQPAAAASQSFVAAMDAAAKARQVPLPLIEATAYVNTRWEWITTPADDGGVGPMNILPSQMAQAAALSGRSPVQIAGDLASNLDAGAALLAHYHATGTGLVSWQPAMASTQGTYVAGQIFDVLRSGAARVTSTGEQITLSAQVLPGASPQAAASAPASTDYAPAVWVPASGSNYSVADRAHDYTVDMIVIHDIEGSYGSAIQMFQDPARKASAHYVISYKGQITQMVREKNIAWHAGNWDYNTRAIGIEHEGFAWRSGLYTTAEYDASAKLAASICSRWGVPMDRQHVIGHSQVPDPNNPKLFGGADHHTDPGPYWNWTYYINEAKAVAAKLPSPPHMMPEPVAVNGMTSVTVTWQPARTCHLPITSYTVVAQPGNLTMNLPATATSATFEELQVGVSYTFTVTAINADGQDSMVSNAAIPGRCNNIGVSASAASPVLPGAQVQLTATSSSCPSPVYEFWVLAPGATWQVAHAYSSAATWTWDTSAAVGGTYLFAVWAQDAGSPGTFGNNLGRYDDFNAGRTIYLTPVPCTSNTAGASPLSPQMVGTSVTISAMASGCPHPGYQFWMLGPGSTKWQLMQDYTTSRTLSWSTTGKAAGTYRFSVWVRDASSRGAHANSMGSYDSFTNSQYFTVTPGCPAVTVSAAPASPSTAGVPVTITGSAPGCPNPSFEVWVLYPYSVTWRLASPYSTSNGFDWSTAGQPVGTYRFSVWVKDAASAGTYANGMGKYDAFNAGLYYTLS